MIICQPRTSPRGVGLLKCPPKKSMSRKERKEAQRRQNGRPKRLFFFLCGFFAVSLRFLCALCERSFFSRFHGRVWWPGFFTRPAMAGDRRRKSLVFHV